MSANRHLGRIIALQTLYEQSLRESCGEKDVDLDKILSRNTARYKKSLDDVSFVEGLSRGAFSKASELDSKLQPLAPEWPLDQISRIDHMVLRLGAYELMYHTDIPPKVIINEAVELAKGFGGDSSSRFINGVLGTLYRNINPNAEKESKKDVKKDSNNK